MLVGISAMWQSRRLARRDRQTGRTAQSGGTAQVRTVHSSIRLVTIIAAPLITAVAAFLAGNAFSLQVRVFITIFGIPFGFLVWLFCVAMSLLPIRWMRRREPPRSPPAVLLPFLARHYEKVVSGFCLASVVIAPLAAMTILHWPRR
jgi:hypothetical protein